MAKADDPAALADRFTRVRRFTEALARPLSPEDCCLQSMPDASPTKWHLAHSSWFFEALALGPAGEPPFDPAFGYLFNSYYEALGPRHARPRRGMLSRPSLVEVLAYRADVDRRILARLAGEPPAAFRAVVELGLHHEQQHQELILTDIKHALSESPLFPAYRASPAPGSSDDRAAARPGGVMGWIEHGEGVFSIGHGGEGFAFDNEGPAHKVYLRAFRLADRLVTAGDVLEFIADGGYARPDLWLSDGWAAARAGGWEAPLYWVRREPAGPVVTAGELAIFRLDGLRALDPGEPACHLSYYEADAFARWAGARLPTEAEWEAVASRAPLRGNFAESGRLHPAPAGERGSGGDGAQLFGDAWEWTASAYLPYPGFRPWEGAVGEYNGKFMSGQMVLRGGSCATPEGHVRASYRNFFPPGARWQFSGLRLARDA
jgi:ergothioneine biosynthesis protein EgtB